MFYAFVEKMKDLWSKFRKTKLADPVKVEGDSAASTLPPEQDDLEALPSNPQQQTPTRANIESLPLELRIAILLAVPDLHALRSIVLASQSLHQAYVHQRRSILLQVLLRDLGPSFLLDAITVLESSRLPCVGPDRPSGIKAFLETYEHSSKSKETPLPTFSAR